MAPTIFEKLNIFQVVENVVPSRSKGSPMKCAFEKLRCTRQTVRRFDKLNKEILEFYSKNAVSIKKKQAVLHFINSLKLKLHFNEDFGPRTKIETFGSMANGMATESSDLDLAITVGDGKKYDKEYKVVLLQNILVSLEAVGCQDIESILGAHVPIIKCKWTDQITKIQLEIDISIFNPLAVRNTALLRQYCAWDKRLPQLAFYLKKFAKEEEISGANKRFLSSYALVIMLIHYLQHIKVLPVLQEEFRTKMDIPVVEEGFDCYFDTHIIPKWSCNKSSVAELFYGFLEYYADFNYDYVIKIDRSRTRLQEKDFNNSPLAVQDPFIYTRNVAGMVSWHNTRTIVQLFRHKAQVLREECHTSSRVPVTNIAALIQTISASSKTDDRKRRQQSPIEILMGMVVPPPRPMPSL